MADLAMIELIAQKARRDQIKKDLKKMREKDFFLVSIPDET